MQVPIMASASAGVNRIRFAEPLAKASPGACHVVPGVSSPSSKIALQEGPQALQSAAERARAPAIACDSGLAEALPPGALARQYKNKCTEGAKVARVPRYVQACKGKRWTVVLRRKDGTGSKRLVCYACRSWRCAGDCARRNSAQWFARIKTAFDRAPENWVFITLSLNRRDWPDEESAFKESSACWARLRSRLQHTFGKYTFVQCVEQHRKGWPHFHIAIQNKQIASRCATERLAFEFKTDWLKGNAMSCGFGLIMDVSAARSSDAIAGYIVKCAALPGELSKGSQVPVNAPKGFRRIRASKGFLPPKIKSEEFTGHMEFGQVEIVQASLERAQEVISARRVLAARRVAADQQLSVNPQTGEIVCDLLMNPVVPAKARRLRCQV